MDTRRAVDIAVCSLALPLLGFAAAAAWATQRRSPFYRQTRIGLNGHPFKAIKFRTMNGDGSKSFDQRTTWVSRAARRHGIDEWPQIINILKGDMSLIGPRPMSWIGNDAGRKIVGRKKWNRRHRIRPGLIPPSLIEEKLNRSGYVSPYTRWKADMDYIKERHEGRALQADLRLIWAAMKAVATGRVDPQAYTPPPETRMRHAPAEAPQSKVSLG